MTTFMLIVLVLFILAQLADIYTTERALANGGFEENPIIRWAMENFGRGWIILKLALGAASAAILIYFNSPIGLLIGAAITGAIAWRNTRYY